MVVLIAPDKFKGSLNANEVCAAVREGLMAKYPEARVMSVPLADGGEGTCNLLTDFFHGKIIRLEVSGPLFKPVLAEYGISEDGTTAFIEMARASGLQLLSDRERNPLYTSTYGTGELIRHALDEGVKQIILGIGGSATNDAGLGMAAALGFEFFDKGKNPLHPVGENLVHLHTIRSDKIHPRLKQVGCITLCDVSNPLHGPDGAAFVYGPQKGADQESVHLLDKGLQNFERIASEHFKQQVDFPGAGAAGGLGAGASIFLNAILKKGIAYFITATGLHEKIMQADLVITGEGKLDQQSLSGKVVIEVSRLAKLCGKPVIAVCGQCQLNSQELSGAGIQQVIPLVRSSISAEDAMQRAYSLIKDLVEKEIELT
jgi:glycerate 2-kinase